MKTLPNKIENLNKIVNFLDVPKYFFFNFKSFKQNKSLIISKIQKKFKKK